LTFSTPIFKGLLVWSLLVFWTMPSLMAQDHENEYTDSLKTLLGNLLESGETDSALAINSKLMRYYYNIGDDYEYVRQHVNRAEVLRMIGGQEEGLQTLLSVEDLANTLPLSTVRSTFYNRKAAILFELKRTYESLEAVHESQRIDSIKGYKWRLFSNLNLEGAIYRDLGKYKEAQKVLEEAYVFAAQAKDSAEWASAAYNLTHLNWRNKNYTDAVKYGRKFSDTHPIVENNVSYGDILHIIGEAYAELGMYDSAFYWNDSAFGVRMVHMRNIIDDNVNKYEIVNELEKERLQNTVLKAESERSNLQILILALAALVAILLVFFANKQRLQYKKSSEQEKIYNQELEESLAFKNKLISIVAHDIRNPMASLKGLIHVYNEGLVDEKDLKTMMAGLEASVSNVDLLLENLLNWVRTQSDNLNPFLELVEVNQLVNNAIAEAGPQLKAKSIQINSSDLSGHEKIMVDTNFMSFILRNILSNAIKYSPDGGEIQISCKHENKMDCLIIKDFGKGMNPDTLQRLNSSQSINSTLGTGKEKGTGLGIALSREFLQKLKGKMEVESALGEGTSVKIYLPLAPNN